jgi:5-oxoprolinase (ATP-hydrolysing)/N-methylhydantoinase B
MRFSENGYYIEKYVKCANCGLLIYDEGIRAHGEAEVYCSDWCIEWARLRDSGQDYFQLPIVQPTIRTQR